MDKRFDFDVFLKRGNIVILYSVDPRVICAAQHSSYELSWSGCNVTFAGYHIGLVRFNAAYLSNVRKHLRELKLLVCRFGQPAQTPLCTHSIPVLRNGVRVHCLTSLSLSSPLPLSHCSGKNSITAAKQPAKVGIPSSTVIDWGNESFFVARVRLFRRPTCTVIHQLAILYRVVTEIHPLFLKNHLFVNSELDLINYVWFSSIFLAAERFFSRGIPESYYGKTDLNNFCWRSKINLHH